MLIQIFDLDGTLTDENYSLWNLITQKCIPNPREFDEAAEKWKLSMLNDPGKYPNKRLASQEITEHWAKLFYPELRSSFAVQAVAREIIIFMLECSAVRLNAVQYLNKILEKGHICVISTASYIEGAISFIDVMVSAGYISNLLAENILISVTQVNWKEGVVEHMNVDDGKIENLVKLFGSSINELKPQIFCVFRDDPEINDKKLLF